MDVLTEWAARFPGGVPEVLAGNRAEGEPDKLLGFSYEAEQDALDVADKVDNSEVVPYHGRWLIRPEQP